VQVGVTLRNMGPQSTATLMAECARAAEQAGLESLWITDHIAIPPDDAAGSDGRYIDPLVMLGWLAGITRHIKLATGVIVLPYRPPLQLARQVAALQELSDGRLLLGVGIGWMEAEFRVLGLRRSQRAHLSDESLAFLERCFAADVVEVHGQPFLFLPRPAKPPVLVGGRAPHALERAARYGDGWLPMGLTAAELARQRTQYRERTAAAGKPPGSITVMTSLPLHDAVQLRDALGAYADAGADRVVCGLRYATIAEYRRALELLAGALAG
jgi:probable F420-dependent oxidoreductase